MTGTMTTKTCKPPAGPTDIHDARAAAIAAAAGLVDALVAFCAHIAPVRPDEETTRLLAGLTKAAAHVVEAAGEL